MYVQIVSVRQVQEVLTQFKALVRYIGMHGTVFTGIHLMEKCV